MDISFDRKTFRALSSDARIDILKLLAKRNYLQSEISQELGLKAPTVKEHMDALIGAGLVNRLEEGRKWKYFELTQKGKAIFYPEQKKIIFLLASLVLSVGGGFFVVLRDMFGGVMLNAGSRDVPAFAASEMKAAAAPAAMDFAPQTASVPWGWIAYAVLLIVIVFFLIYFIWKNGRYRRAKSQKPMANGRNS